MSTTTIKRLILVATILYFAIGAGVGAVQKVLAQDVKYCKNFQTGEIIVVEINMPCPYPTARI